MGMNFISFLIMLVISAVESATLRYVLSFRVRTGIVSLTSTVVWGWIGGWLGSPVSGVFHFDSVCIIPAVLGSVALIVLMVDLVKTAKAAS